MDRPDNNTFTLDGITYPSGRNIPINHQATFPDRMTFGDPTARDQEFLSNWGLRKVPGGIGIEEYDEGADAERIWWSCLDTRYGRGLTLPPLVTATRPAEVPSTAVSRPLGKIGTQAYTCFSWSTTHRVYGWNEATGVWLTPTSPNNLTAAPVGKPVTYAGTSTTRVFVPLGANGYVVLAEADAGLGTLTITTVTGASDPDAVAFCVYTVTAVSQLYAIDGAGFLYLSGTTGLTGAWTQPDDRLPSTPNKVRIDDSETIRHLVVYPGLDRLPALHAITDRGIHVYNPLVPAFERTQFNLAPHPDNALGAEVWRPGEHIHVTQGLERWQYTVGDVYIPGTGPAKDDGVPAQFRGKLVDLEGEVSFLFALLQGSSANTYAENAVEDGGTYHDDPLYVSGDAAFSALLCDTSLGWHCLWESPVPLELTWGMVADIVSPGYAYWFGGNQGDVYRLPLRASFHNARQGAILGLDTFAPTGYLITGWFDAAMLNFDKLTDSLSVTMTQATVNEYVDVSYQIDDNETVWTALGRVTARGKTLLHFGVDAGGIARGVAFNRIRLRLDFARGAATTTSPVFIAFALHFLKIPQDAQTFEVEVDLVRENWDLMSADAMRDTLAALLVANRFVVFEHARRRYRVLLTRMGGADATGRDEQGTRLLSLLALERLADAA